jgi:hypothetical protein
VLALRQVGLQHRGQDGTLRGRAVGQRAEEALDLVEHRRQHRAHVDLLVHVGDRRRAFGQEALHPPNIKGTVPFRRG